MTRVETLESAARRSLIVGVGLLAGGLAVTAAAPAHAAPSGDVQVMQAPAAAQPGPDVAAGQTLYTSKCGGCHSLDQNRVGPKHRGVVGRKIASVPDYDYSPAIKKLGGVWTPARLDQWLQGPQAMAHGSKMFLQVSDPAQRKAIIAYLSANSPAVQVGARPPRSREAVPTHLSRPKN